MDAVAGGFRRTGHCNIPLQGKSAYRADVGRWYLAGVPSNKKKRTEFNHLSVETYETNYPRKATGRTVPAQCHTGCREKKN